MRAGYCERCCTRKAAPLVVQNVGPMFQLMFTDQPAIRDYRDFCKFVDRSAFQRFVLSLVSVRSVCIAVRGAGIRL